MDRPQEAPRRDFPAPLRTQPDSAAPLVRPARLADAEGIAHVHAASWRETYGRFFDDPDNSPWFRVEGRITMWRTTLSEDPSQTVVAEGTTGIVGFASTAPTPEPDAARPEELTMIYVLENAHGTGTGQALLDAVLGDRPASLWVAADNPRAHAFYRRNGFRPDGTESSFGPIPRTVRLVR
ncbi:GNAT family N-acetyltransferase [Microbacterium mcarthurae (nom. nud.)]|jgi:ribosomal protein S18 acetylase RimI-like enzyme|uniref:GNAT family N-acetyltransferase n=1 Tax=Microbacterium mcarthurae TaxID=3035918 RepID=A0ABW9GBJ1_9MICO